MKKRLVFALLASIFLLASFVQSDSNTREIKVWDSEDRSPHAFFLSTLEIAITEIRFESQNSYDNARMIVEALEIKPSTLPDIDNPYQYIAIGKFGMPDEDINSIKVKFRLEKSWVDNFSDIGDIKSYSFEGGWKILNSNYVGEDNAYYYYESRPGMFSYFAIGGDKKEVVDEDNLIDEDNMTSEAAATDDDVKRRSLLSLLWNENTLTYLLILIPSILLLMACFSFAKMLINGEFYDNPREMRNFIEEELAEGLSKNDVKAELMDAGWPTGLVGKVVGHERLPPDMEIRIKSFIHLMSARNKSYDEIKKTLVSQGWDADVIGEIINEFTAS